MCGPSKIGALLYSLCLVDVPKKGQAVLKKFAFFSEGIACAAECDARIYVFVRILFFVRICSYCCKTIVSLVCSIYLTCIFIEFCCTLVCACFLLSFFTVAAFAFSLVDCTLGYLCFVLFVSQYVVVT